MSNPSVRAFVQALFFTESQTQTITLARYRRHLLATLTQVRGKIAGSLRAEPCRKGIVGGTGVLSNKVLMAICYQAACAS